MDLDFSVCDGRARGPGAWGCLGVWGAELPEPCPQDRWAHHPEPPPVLALLEERGRGCSGCPGGELPGATCDLWEFCKSTCLCPGNWTQFTVKTKLNLIDWAEVSQMARTHQR